MEEAKWNDLAESEAIWLFPESQINISNVILGKGAFGEVRVAKWRNIDVAAKRMHSLGNETNPYDSFMQEMKLLSQLRHPNLILFLGVCYNEATQLPTTILTELMPSNLYTILEENKIKLTLPDILDISIDIISGLHFLHNHSPCIIHRDISAKNILIGGNKAKITDLGQSKIFSNSVLSRQTSMPGAMAYSAPEVLTGKYNEKIDIFSFGVLLIQMSTGDYPRIERREEQITTAKANFKALSRILSKCLSFQPQDRPNSQTISEFLRDIQSNDRFYPPSRRLPPQCDLGVMARSWLTEKVDERCKDMKLALEQTTRRLAAEEARWRDEAEKVDIFSKRIDEKESLFHSLQQESESRLKEIESYRQKKIENEENLRTLEEMIKDEKLCNDKLRKENEDLISSLLVKDHRISLLESQITSYQGNVDDLSKKLLYLQESETKAIQSVKENVKTVEIQSEQIEELESRLEQALTRWKREKELVSSETNRCSKLRSANADLIEKNGRQASEIELLTARLVSYDALPMPEEIKMRMKDYEEDVVRFKETIETLHSDKRGLSHKLSEFENQFRDMQNTLQEKESLIAELQNKVTIKIEKETKMKEENDLCIKEVKELKQNLQDCEMKIDILLNENSGLKLNLSNAEAKALAASTNSQASASASTSALEGLKEEYLHEHHHHHHHDGAGSAALMLAHDAFLPETMGAESLVSLRVNAHTPNSNSNSSSSSSSNRHNNSNTAAAGNDQHSTNQITQLNSTHEYKSQEEEEEEEEIRKKEEEQDAQAKLLIQRTFQDRGSVGLLELFRDKKSNEHIIWRTARLMRELIHQDKTQSLRNECISDHVDENVLQAMETFSDSEILQGQCIRLLGSLSYGNDLVRRRIGGNKGIFIIIRAMEGHLEDENVILHSCTTLTNIFHNNIDNRLRFIDAFGLDVLLNAMRYHSDSVNIQKRSCLTILTLVGSDETARIVGTQSSAIDLVVSAMKNFKLDPGVQQFGCWAIANLALAGEDIQLILKNEGVLEICQTALEIHSNDEEVIRQARNAIGSLGPNK